MQQHPHPLRPWHTAVAIALAISAVTGCGGGGDNSSGGPPTAGVTSMSVDAEKYGQLAYITINGTTLDSTLAVTSDACVSMTLLNAAPYVSSSTTAYYSCKVSGALSGSVVAKSNGTQLKSASFTVPQPVVTLDITNGQTVNGSITITLDATKAPKTALNFLNYVNSGFYDGTIFHRDVANFVMQAGGYANPVTDLSTATLKTTPFPPIAVENTGLSNVKWSIAMANANTQTNAVTTTSQFFFNLADNTTLDGNYPAFGAITAGTAVAQAILAAPANCTTVQFPSGASETDCLPVPNAVITRAKQIQ